MASTNKTTHAVILRQSRRISRSFANAQDDLKLEHRLCSKRKKGFSLIELMIAITILGIIMAGLATVFSRGYSVFKIEKSKNLLQEETRTALDITDSWIRKAYTVLSTYTSPTDTTYTTGAHVLALKIQSIDANSALITGKYDYIIFKMDQSDTTQLDKITYADAASSRASSTLALATNVNSFSFIYYDVSGSEITENYENSILVKTSISSQEVTGGTTNTSQLSSETKIRNK